MGFRFVRNLAGFPANPVKYTLAGDTSAVTYSKDALVTISGGKIVAANNLSSNVFGVMAETVDIPANEDGVGLVYDNPLNVYEAPYGGTGTPQIGQATTVLSSDAGTVDADASSGPLTVIAVDTAKGIVHVVLTGHLLT